MSYVDRRTLTIHLEKMGEMLNRWHLKNLRVISDFPSWASPIRKPHGHSER